MKKAIVIGASSGIGRELSLILVNNGYSVAIAARRIQLLQELAEKLSSSAIVREIDVNNPEMAMAILTELIDELGDVNLIVYASGTGAINNALQWKMERDCIETNVLGFTAVANIAIHYFLKKKSGHFVAISSIAALRGGKSTPAYHASKAYISSYLERLRQRITKSQYPIIITDIKPGFVNTEMAQGDNLFWVAPVKKAAQQIYTAIRCKKSHAYITKRWRLVAWLLKSLPDTLYNRL